MAFCEFCDSNVEDGVRVCPHCAAPMPEKKKETKNNASGQTNSGTYTYTYTYTQTSTGGNSQPVNANMYFQNQAQEMPKPKRASNGLAIASLIFGIISLVAFCCLGGFLGIIGLILGIIALTDKQCCRKAVAIVGTILSAFTLFATIWFLIIGSSDSESENIGTQYSEEACIGVEVDVLNEDWAV